MILQFLDKTLWHYVGMVRSFFPSGGGAAMGGSGTLINRRLILTAGHVVYDPSKGGYPTRIDVELGGAQRFTVSSKVFRTTTNWVNTDSFTMNPLSAFDIGAILLPTAIDPRVVAAVPVIPGTNLAGVELTVAGFPVQANLYGSLYGASAMAVNPYPQYDESRAFYPIPTIGGMSGGPVYSRDAMGRISLRAVHTSIYNDYGSAIKLYPALANLVQAWANEAMAMT